MKRSFSLAAVVAMCHLGAVSALAIDIPSDGSDGALNCGTLQGIPNHPCGVPCVSGGTFTIDLSAAASQAWDSPSPVKGSGVYDQDKWAVVFKYSCIDIPANITIKFKNHPSGAPVVWLVQDTVTITGTVDANGASGFGNGSVPSYAIAGPGGFRGGRPDRASSLSSAGFGPGGSGVGDGNSEGSGGGYGKSGNFGGSGPGIPGTTYGNAGIIPLIGGSGAAGGETTGSNTDSGGGGAGGGAILIATSTRLQIGGTIRANGGNGAGNWTGGNGSGGAIRLIADTISGGGFISAIGGNAGSGSGRGGDGRIRVEANVNTLVDGGNPLFSFDVPAVPPLIWPPAGAPKLILRTLGGIAIPADPKASFTLADVNIAHQPATEIFIDAENVPTTSTVTVRIVPNTGPSTTELAYFVSGDDLASTWGAVLELQNGFSSIQVHAVLP